MERLKVCAVPPKGQPEWYCMTIAAAQRKRAPKAFEAWLSRRDPDGAILKKTKELYPLVFVDTIHICLTPVVVSKICQDAVSSLKEKLERLFLLQFSAEVEPDFSAGYLTINKIIGHAELEKKLGIISRHENDLCYHIDSTKAKEYCKTHSKGASLLTYGHTHLGAEPKPSWDDDLNASMADRPKFIASMPRKYMIGPRRFALSAYGNNGIKIKFVYNNNAFPDKFSTKLNLIR